LFKSTINHKINCRQTWGQVIKRRTTHNQKEGPSGQYRENMYNFIKNKMRIFTLINLRSKIDKISNNNNQMN